MHCLYEDVFKMSLAQFRHLSDIFYSVIAIFTHLLNIPDSTTPLGHQASRWMKTFSHFLASIAFATNHNHTTQATTGSYQQHKKIFIYLVLSYSKSLFLCTRASSQPLGRLFSIRDSINLALALVLAFNSLCSSGVQTWKI